MKTTTIKTLVFSAFIILSQIAFGQNDSSMINRMGQVSFFPPLSTNGLESGRVINNVSINLFAGYQGGLEGIEFGGFANVIKHDMKGAQFAGFGNTVLENTYGSQFSGFYNVNMGYTKGAQFAGFINTVVDSADAFQAAGFTNVLTKGGSGAQIAGFSNHTLGNYQGAQIAGFVNTNIGHIDGPQIAGFSNIATGNVKGLQLAGFSNIATGNVLGSQISGFINVGRNIKGSQIGFINIADSVEGAAIGFLSIVKDGYRRFEFEANETFYGLLRAKTGTERFYNIFSFGMRPTNDHFYWVYGYGVGTLFNLNDKLDLNFDLESFFMVQDDYLNINVNQLNRLKANVSYGLSDRIEVFAGPSFNLMVSDNSDENGNLIGSDLTPYTFTSSTYRSVMLESYVGFNIGVRLR
jgi:hypothetical protein